MSHVSLLSTFVPIQTASFAKSSLTTVKLVSAKPSSSACTMAVSKSAAMEMKKREPSGIMKPRRVSPEMQEFLGGMSEIPRTQALKEIWAHIKQHDLQDPTDKKIIICDEKLKKIFGGKERVGFLEIAGLMSPHFLK